VAVDHNMMVYNSKFMVLITVEGLTKIKFYDFFDQVCHYSCKTCKGTS